MARNVEILPPHPPVVPIAKNKGGRPPYQRDERTARQVEARTGLRTPHNYEQGV